MKTPIKSCVVCGKEFAKPYYTGLPEWKERRFCSRSCSDQSKLGSTLAGDSAGMRVDINDTAVRTVYITGIESATRVTGVIAADELD